MPTPDFAKNYSSEFWDCLIVRTCRIVIGRWLMAIFYFGICATLLASILGCRQIDVKAFSSTAEPSGSSGVSLGNEPLLLAEMPQFITSWYPSRVPVFLTDDGTIHAVWNSLVENDEEPNVMYALKTPGTAHWSAPVSLTEKNKELRGFVGDAFATKDGVIHILTVRDQRGHGSRLWHSVWSSEGIAPARVEMNTDDLANVRLFPTRDSGVGLVYQIRAKVFYRHWSPAEKRWTEPQELADGGVRSFDLAVSRDAGAMLVTSTVVRRHFRVMSLTDTGATVLGESALRWTWDAEPYIASFAWTGTGEGLVAWDGVNGAPLLCSFFSNGQFAQPIRLVGAAHSPCLLAADGNGVFHMLVNTHVDVPLGQERHRGLHFSGNGKTGLQLKDTIDGTALSLLCEKRGGGLRALVMRGALKASGEPSIGLYDVVLDTKDAPVGH